jgi:hypothetical protein
MKTTLAVYTNSDDALLLWSVDQLDEAVEGFSIQRKLRRGSAAEETTWIDNYAPPGPKAYQNATASAPTSARSAPSPGLITVSPAGTRCATAPSRF